MQFDQKVNQLNLYAGVDYNKAFADEAALGWEVVSSNISNDRYGKIMIVTYRRSKTLKLYQRFCDLGNKIDYLREKFIAQGKADLALAKKKVTNLFILFQLMIIGLVILYPLMLLFVTTGFFNGRIDNIIFGIVGLIAAVVISYYCRKVNKKIKYMASYKSELSISIEDQINNLYEEARNLDHSYL